jgi:hypothetical protein
VRTSFVEKLFRIFAVEREVARDWSEQFNDESEMIFIARIFLSRVRLEQVVACGQLKRLQHTYRLVYTQHSQS